MPSRYCISHILGSTHLESAQGNRVGGPADMTRSLGGPKITRVGFLLRLNQGFLELNTGNLLDAAIIFFYLRPPRDIPESDSDFLEIRRFLPSSSTVPA
eukprot:370054-Rhodomonas_salina.1